MQKKSIPILLSFLCMGFGYVGGPLTSLLQSAFDLSNFVSGLVTFVIYIMYGLLAIPFGIYQHRKSKKTILLVGLFCVLIGMLLPIIAKFSSYQFILSSLFVLGAGVTALQVSAHPAMYDVSKEKNLARNLTFGQLMKAIGSLSGAIIPLFAVKYFDADWRLLFPIYAIVTMLTLIYLYFSNIEGRTHVANSHTSYRTGLKLLKKPFMLSIVLGIFLFVGAEVCMSARLPNYLAMRFDMNLEEFALQGTLFFLIALLVGRFIGSIVLNWMEPPKFLFICSILSILSLLALFVANKINIAIICILIAGLGFANIFPIMFSMAIEKIPDKRDEISGLIITALIGGAIIPLLFGLVADIFGLITGFIIPLTCILYVFYIAVKNLNYDKLQKR